MLLGYVDFNFYALGVTELLLGYVDFNFYALGVTEQLHLSCKNSFLCGPCAHALYANE